MAQHKQLTWTELRVGLFVLAGAVLLAVVIFYVTGGSRLGTEIRPARLSSRGGRTYRGRAGARGRRGCRQRGKDRDCRSQAGRSGIERPEYRSRSAPAENFQSYIRSDSTAGLITEGLLGNRYVDIDRGYVGRVLENNEEIPGREEKALKEVVERSADLMDSLSSITKQASAVLTDVRNGRGSLGKFMVDPAAYNHLNQYGREPRPHDRRHPGRERDHGKTRHPRRNV